MITISNPTKKFIMKNLIFLIFFCCLLPQFNYCQDTFKNKEEYLTHLLKKTTFDKDKIVINNFTKHSEFVKDVVGKELFTFYGVVYNDKLYSASQLSVKSCWGQFLKLCENIDDGDIVTDNKNIQDIVYLKNISFSSNKKTVVFIYSCSLKKGTLKTI